MTAKFEDKKKLNVTEDGYIDLADLFDISHKELKQTREEFTKLVEGKEKIIDVINDLDIFNYGKVGYRLFLLGQFSEQNASNKKNSDLIMGISALKHALQYLDNILEK